MKWLFVLDQMFYEAMIQEFNDSVAFVMRYISKNLFKLTID